MIKVSGDGNDSMIIVIDTDDGDATANDKGLL